MSPEPDQSVIVAIDPGTAKCGAAVLRGPEVLDRRVVAVADLPGVLAKWAGRWRIGTVLVGGGTGANRIRMLVADVLPAAPLAHVGERDTTLEARRLYFADHPRKGWRRLVPLSLQVPPEPYDDYAAVVLARRHAEGGGLRKAR